MGSNPTPSAQVVELDRRAKGVANLPRMADQPAQTDVTVTGVGRTPDVSFTEVGRMHVHDNGALTITRRGASNETIGAFAPGQWVRAVSNEHATIAPGTRPATSVEA